MKRFRHTTPVRNTGTTPSTVGRPYIVSLFEHQEFF